MLKLSAQVKTHVLLKDYTTLNVGGPADRLVLAQKPEHIVETIMQCRQNNTPYKILGGGSNVVISDKGYRGTIIINQTSGWEVLKETPDISKLTKTQPRLEAVGDDYYKTDDLFEVQRAKKIQPVIVRVVSGIRIIPMMKSLFREGISGLEWFAGIPATVGGAVFMNMHGAHIFFGDLVYRALIFDGRNQRMADQNYFEFDYDYSVLHKTQETLLSVDLVLQRGNVERARRLARDWARRKALQPQKSAGCVFRNVTVDEQKRLFLPTSSIGYLVDKVLGLKGTQKGDAIISPRHAAFIENLGQATAADVYFLYNTICEAARNKCGIELVPEIEFIGEF